MKLLDRLMAGTHKYSVTDFGMLKFALAFVGILLGTYFADFFARYIVIVWVLAIFCYGWIIVSTLYKAGFICKQCSRK